MKLAIGPCKNSAAESATAGTIQNIDFIDDLFRAEQSGQWEVLGQG
jgi:hypothetical protein